MIDLCCRRAVFIRPRKIRYSHDAPQQRLSEHRARRLLDEKNGDGPLANQVQLESAASDSKSHGKKGDTIVYAVKLYPRRVLLQPTAVKCVKNSTLMHEETRPQVRSFIGYQNEKRRFRISTTLRHLALQQVCGRKICSIHYATLKILMLAWCGSICIPSSILRYP